MERNVLIVINKSAGTGLALKLHHRYFRFLKRRDIKFFPYYTTGKEDSKKIAQLLYHKSFDTVSVFGGDGTINAVVNAVGKGNQLIHIVPCGTGNDLIKNISDRTSYTSHFQAVIDQESAEIDIFNCNGMLFSSCFGIGFDGYVCETLERNRSRLMAIKTIAYWAAIIKNLFRYKEVELEIEDRKQQVFMLNLMNNDRYGGGFKIAPEADMTDKLLDLVIIDKVGLMARLKNLLRLKNGKHISLPMVHYKKVASYAIYSKAEIPAQVDGELIYDKNYTVIFERKLSFLV